MRRPKPMTCFQTIQSVHATIVSVIRPAAEPGASTRASSRISATFSAICSDSAISSEPAASVLPAPRVETISAMTSRSVRRGGLWRGRHPIDVPRVATCAVCHGSGAKAGTQPVTCTGCAGRGQVRYSQGFFAVARTCPQCGGAGKVIKDPCAGCDGAGRVREEKTISVKVPAGVDDGSRLRVAGEGEAGFNGGPSGDLYVFLSVREHESFTRRDYDIHSEQAISFTQAALGADLQTATIDGSESLRIPPGLAAESGVPSARQGRAVPAGRRPRRSLRARLRAHPHDARRRAA